ncbi:hypothetical protein RHMOL_Rhmol13G0073700 [Rhododendron molle]|uniref:Uncharacterized protein n=1 Tax=Rhododendron molle TaxID=49168 RepID=A0ACC0L4K7_RHOML|nr:hypothetical protein RHMOL_Rhmol13G0073700 [Rhododendron molle]
MIALGSNALGRSRPKLTLNTVVRKDLSIVDLCEQVALDKAQWSKKIYVADLKRLGHKTQIGLVWFRTQM